MTHKHEWKAKYDKVLYGESFQCECKAIMETDEIERRLNATEELSAEDAWEIINATVAIAEEVGITAIIPKRDPLRAYAERMEDG